jgi:hypothetical protein
MQFPYPSLRQGLVGAWCPSLGATGYTLSDRSGRGNNGTLNNMGGQDNWQASGTGRSIYFDGTNDYVSIPKSFTLTPPCSFMCWFKPDGTQAAYSSPLFSRGANPAGFDFYLGSTLAITWNTAYYNDSTGISINSGVWNFACAVVQPTGYVLYWSAGAGISSYLNPSISNIAIAFSALEIGRDSFGTRLFKGNFDDARFYSRALTLAEIRLLSTRRGIGLTPQPNTRATYPTKFQIRVGGTWREADAYQRVAGVWKPAPPSIRAAGTWRNPVPDVAGSAPNNTPSITANQVFSTATASVSFTAGTNTGSAITNYKYRYALSPAAPTGSYTACSPAVTASPLAIPGLDIAQTYLVQIIATNAFGDGPASAAQYIDGSNVA